MRWGKILMRTHKKNHSRTLNYVEHGHKCRERKRLVRIAAENRSPDLTISALNPIPDFSWMPAATVRLIGL